MNHYKKQIIILKKKLETAEKNTTTWFKSHQEQIAELNHLRAHSLRLMGERDHFREAEAKAYKEAQCLTEMLHSERKIASSTVEELKSANKALREQLKLAGAECYAYADALRHSTRRSLSQIGDLRG